MASTTGTGKPIDTGAYQLWVRLRPTYAGRTVAWWFSGHPEGKGIALRLVAKHSALNLQSPSTVTEEILDGPSLTPAASLFLPPRQLDLLAAEADTDDATSSTFADNLSLPVHRWFRYSAGFSAGWVRDVIAAHGKSGQRRVLDPFAGSGTVSLEAERAGVEAIGLEAHPFVFRIAKTKLLWRSDPGELHRLANTILATAQASSVDEPVYPPIIHRCFPPDPLRKLHGLKLAWSRQADGSAASELTWLALASILRACSPVGTAQWQYLLPNKSKARMTDPFVAFRNKVALMCQDMAVRQTDRHGPAARILRDDARTCAQVPEGWADLVITSPPYANNYDYADATRLEMSFFGEIESWGDLQSTVRQHLIRSCTQHVAPLRQSLDTHLSEPLLAPVFSELKDVCLRLEGERDSHGGKKPYHLMVAAYFADLARVWHALRRACAPGALACFVIGDSAPYGIHAPVERWLGELAVSAGFRSFRFEKTRDRNVKWKNRKHRVPLHEGRLWVEG